MDLVWPSIDYLPAYSDALRRGWSPDNRRAEAGLEELHCIEENPELFITQQVDREGKGPAIILPDGQSVARLPGYHRWMWDGDFCGVISIRWKPGTTELPPTCLGHIGYAVVPWKRRLGYATRALELLLKDAAHEGLPFVELTTDENNIASQKVIESNGGVLFERFLKPATYGDDAEALRYRIHFSVTDA